jgi:hypothetical protein
MLDEETVTSWKRRFAESFNVGEFLNLKLQGIMGN